MLSLVFVVGTGCLAATTENVLVSAVAFLASTTLVWWMTITDAREAKVRDGDACNLLPVATT